MKRDILIIFVVLTVSCLAVQDTEPRPADRVASDVPSQLVFSSPLATLDPRRQLSMQQQAVILTDVQRHQHRFQQPQTATYSQPSQTTHEQKLQFSTEKPALHTQHLQFASRQHNAVPASQRSQTPPPDTKFLELPSVPQQQQLRITQLPASNVKTPAVDIASSSYQANEKTRSPENTASDRVIHPHKSFHGTISNSSVVQHTRQLNKSHLGEKSPQSSGLSPQEQLRSLRRRPSRVTQTQDPVEGPEFNRRSQVDNSQRDTVDDQQLLQNERQKLLQQIRGYTQQQKASPSQRRTTSRQFPNTGKKQESSATSQSRVVSNDNPLEAQESRPQTQMNPLRQQQQQRQIQTQLQKQFQQQFIQRQELIRKLKEALENAPDANPNDNFPSNANTSSTPATPSKVNKLQLYDIHKDISPVPRTLIEKKNPQLQVIPFLPTQTSVPEKPEVLFEELTKGVLPPGAEFEVIRHKQDGGLEEVGNLPQNFPDKKVTFVFLEEQPDGTVKVQGVRRNNNEQNSSEKSNPEDVDTIIKKLEEGDLKLPPSTRLSSTTSPTGVPSFGTTPQESVFLPTFISRSSLEQSPTTKRPTYVTSPTPSPNHIPFSSSTSKPNFDFHEMEFFPSVTIPTQTEATGQSFTQDSPNFALNNFSPSPTDLLRVSSPYSVSVPSSKESTSLLTHNTSSQHSLSLTNHLRQSYVPHKTNHNVVSSTPLANQVTAIPISTYSTKSPVPSPQYNHFSPTPNPVNLFSAEGYSSPQPLPPLPVFSSSTVSPKTHPEVHRESFVPLPTTPMPPAVVTANANNIFYGVTGNNLSSSRNIVHNNDFRENTEFSGSNEYRSITNNTRLAQVKDSPNKEANSKTTQTLSQVLKKEGLFAMAKFLKESSMDAILNDTGPYTIFAPTDKAFRALLIQLGGPDKAEEKFRENPRLLSGLLLHHVIPGAFPLDSLQDEMTGVSLAGTQLRVNTYNTQDVEWNDVQVTTINGARIQRDQHDMVVPQGIAHAVDRVMFPLPVGDAVQTLQADRERRFTKFLRAIQSSGVAETLTGSQTFTVFAPTDRAFSQLSVADQQRLQSDHEVALTMVRRHVAPGTLYSAGMRYYQVRPSLDPSHAITLIKNAGQLKANNAHVIAHNIPSTNGVIHIIDNFL